MPDNETINKHIHEKVMGECYHVDEDLNVTCEVCGTFVTVANLLLQPDYCSDDSPRRLLNEAVDKAVEMVGEKAFQSSLWLTLKMGVNFYERNEALLIGARATNQQIATAIYNATKVEGK
jgi:hypothetical protein